MGGPSVVSGELALRPHSTWQAVATLSGTWICQELMVMSTTTSISPTSAVQTVASTATATQAAVPQAVQRWISQRTTATAGRLQLGTLIPVEGTTVEKLNKAVSAHRRISRRSGMQV